MKSISLVTMFAALLLLLLLPAYAKVEAASKSIYVIQSMDLKGQSDSTTTLSYNKNGMISVIKDETTVGKLSYDKKGRLKQLYATGGKNGKEKEKFTYSYKKGRISKIVFHNGYDKIVRRYNWSGNKCVVRVSAGGLVTSFVILLDNKRRVKSSTEPDTPIKTTYEYDSKGSLTTMKVEDSTNPEYEVVVTTANKYIGDRLVEASQDNLSIKLHYKKIKVPEERAWRIIAQQDYLKHNLLLGWTGFIMPA